MASNDYDALVERLAKMRQTASDSRRGINYLKAAACGIVASDADRFAAGLAEIERADAHHRQAVGELERELERRKGRGNERTDESK